MIPQGLVNSHANEEMQTTPEASEEEDGRGSRVRPQQQSSDVIRNQGAHAGGGQLQLAEMGRVLRESGPQRAPSPVPAERVWDVSPTSESSADAHASLSTLSPSSVAAGSASASWAAPAKTRVVPKLDLSSPVFAAGKQTRRLWRDREMVVVVVVVVKFFHLCEIVK